MKPSPHPGLVSIVKTEELIIKHDHKVVSNDSSVKIIISINSRYLDLVHL